MHFGYDAKTYVDTFIAWFYQRTMLELSSIGFIQNAWLMLRNDWCGGSQFIIGCLFTYFVLSSTFIILSGAFLIVDSAGWPAFMHKFKIQDNFKFDWVAFKHALRRSAYNLFVVTPIIQYFLYLILSWRGCHIHERLPSLPQLIRDLVIFMVIEEMGFYYSHRLFHHPLLYKHIHKIHHEFTAPFGVVAIACHPIEHIGANMIPLAIGPFVCRSHITVIWLWYILSIFNTVCDHSGYHLPFIHSAEFHDYHHLKFNQCFGVFGILDWLHGTDAAFRKTKQFKRHYTSFSLTPVKMLIP